MDSRLSRCAMVRRWAVMRKSGSLTPQILPGWRRANPDRRYIFCMPLDINCDLGEGEPLARTAALMRSVTSANVACGGHAGDIQSMHRCVRLAKKHRVKLGAHPGLPSTDFGRGAARVKAD